MDSNGFGEDAFTGDNNQANADEYKPTGDPTSFIPEDAERENASKQQRKTRKKDSEPLEKEKNKRSLRSGRKRTQLRRS